VLHGLASFRAGLKIAGAVANNVASERHAELLRAALPPHIRLATLPRNPDAALPSRHLGLQIAAEIDGLDQRLDLLANAVGASCLAELPTPTEFAQPATQRSAEALLCDKTIAVARDHAFCFLYRANIDCLRKLGAQVVYFSPLKDNALPAADAIYLPGGYPELYAAELSSNENLRQHIRSHVEQNKPLLAECGGLMALGDALEDLNGNRHAMFGLLPGVAHMGQRLHAIGSQQALIAGASIRGHTFHYSRFATTLTPCFQAQTQDGRTGEALYRQGSLLASYVHWYFPSNPALVASWF